jgi:hypothetical protein
MIYVVAWLIAMLPAAIFVGVVIYKMGHDLDEEPQSSEERFPRLLQTAQRGS